MDSRKAIEDLQKAVGAAAVEYEKKEQQRQHDERVDTQIKILSAGYDRAGAYNNLVTLGGYAAYFTVWAFMRDQLSETVMLITALSVSLSLTVFIIWQVVLMIFHDRHMRALVKVLSEQDPIKYDKKMKETLKDLDLRDVRFYQSWIVILVLTVVPALVGAGTLLYSFLRSLF